MDVNIYYLSIRVAMLILTTVQPSTATNINELDEGITPAFYYDFTAFGNSVGAPCVFPFFYNGTFYYDCISLDRRNPWCSTTDNYTRDEQWGECLDYDVCQEHMVLSDLWRNIGCDHYSFGKVGENDLHLREGWYRFTGIGGDRLADSCSTYQDCSPENIFWPSILECDSGLTLYYLIPFRGMYMTYHSSCSESSCGINGECYADGRCLYYYDDETMTTDDPGIYTIATTISYIGPFGPPEHKTTQETHTMTLDVVDVTQHVTWDVTWDVTQDVTQDDTYNKTNDGTRNNTDIANDNTTDKQPGSSVTTITHNGTGISLTLIKKCLAWKDWVNESCTIIPIGHNSAKCFCKFPPATSDDTKLGFTGERLDIFIVVAMAVGLLCLCLTLLTFALCQRQINGNKTAQVNLCISLLLAHLLFLFKGGFLKYLHALQVACAVLAGFLHFLFLSAFVWMFIDAVLLFVSAKNLTKIKSKQKKMPGWKRLTVIGYVIPLIVVGVSVAVVPDGYGGKQCWLKNSRGFQWSLLGPIYFILASNLILFIAIFITVTLSLRGLNSEILQRTQTLEDRKLIRTVLFKTMAQFFILGCPWLLVLINSNSIVLEIIFMILISQQGTVIFVVHCVLNQEVRQQYKKWLQTFCLRKKPTTVEKI